MSSYQAKPHCSPTYRHPGFLNLFRPVLFFNPSVLSKKSTPSTKNNSLVKPPLLQVHGVSSRVRAGGLLPPPAWALRWFGSPCPPAACRLLVAARWAFSASGSRPGFCWRRALWPSVPSSWGPWGPGSVPARPGARSPCGFRAPPGGYQVCLFGSSLGPLRGPARPDVLFWWCLVPCLLVPFGSLTVVLTW